MPVVPEVEEHVQADEPTFLLENWLSLMFRKLGESAIEEQGDRRILAPRDYAPSSSGESIRLLLWLYRLRLLLLLGCSLFPRSHA